MVGSGEEIPCLLLGAQTRLGKDCRGKIQGFVWVSCTALAEPEYALRRIVHACFARLPPILTPSPRKMLRRQCCPSRAQGDPTTSRMTSLKNE